MNITIPSLLTEMLNDEEVKGREDITQAIKIFIRAYPRTIERLKEKRVKKYINIAS